jgi:hypothetical protein
MLKKLVFFKKNVKILEKSQISRTKLVDFCSFLRVFGLLNMMLALQKVMIMTCGRWLKSAIKLALKDDFVEYTRPANSAFILVSCLNYFRVYSWLFLP